MNGGSWPPPSLPPNSSTALNACAAYIIEGPLPYKPPSPTNPRIPPGSSRVSRASARGTRCSRRSVTRSRCRARRARASFSRARLLSCPRRQRGECRHQIRLRLAKRAHLCRDFARQFPIALRQGHDVSPIARLERSDTVCPRSTVPFGAQSHRRIETATPLPRIEAPTPTRTFRPIFHVRPRHAARDPNACTANGSHSTSSIRKPVGGDLICRNPHPVLLGLPDPNALLNAISKLFTPFASTICAIVAA